MYSYAWVHTNIYIKVSIGGFRSKSIENIVSNTHLVSERSGREKRQEGAKVRKKMSKEAKHPKAYPIKI